MALSLDKTVNLSPQFLNQLCSQLNLNSVSTGLPVGLTPEDIFHYVYAIFHSPAYRKRYAEFLKIDFPRLPLAHSIELFRTLSKFGSKLTSLHLMEFIKTDQSITKFIGDNNSEVEKISWLKDTVWIDKAHTIGFQGVSESVWNFHIGGYQVCEKWLKDRKGRKLSTEDILCFINIIFALTETMQLMKEIDNAIDQHGGWPSAFASSKSQVS